MERDRLQLGYAEADITPLTPKKLVGARPKGEGSGVLIQKRMQVRKRLHFLCIKCPIVGVRYCETA